VENQDFEIQFLPAVGVKGFEFQTLMVFLGEIIQVLLVRVLQTTVMSFEANVGLHCLLQFGLENLALFLN
jgi:hypothetical protein